MRPFITQTVTKLPKHHGFQGSQHPNLYIEKKFIRFIQNSKNFNEISQFWYSVTKQQRKTGQHFQSCDEKVSKSLVPQSPMQTKRIWTIKTNALRLIYFARS